MREDYGMDGVYSDGLPEDDWVAAYEEMRLLRAAFPRGPLVVHDTIRQEGTAAAEWRPWVQAYATATLLGEGMVSTDGVAWQWSVLAPRHPTDDAPRCCGAVTTPLNPLLVRHRARVPRPRYRTSQFRKANVFGAVKGNAWRGPGIDPPAAADAQDLVQLVYGGRDRPGLQNFSEYLAIRTRLKALWANSTAG
jgi:hypothetical protein